MSAFLTDPSPNAEAADFIRSKAPVSRDVFAKMLPELRARAMAISGIESATVLQQVRDTIAKLPEGADWKAVKADVLSQISPFLIDPNASAEERDQQVNAANRRAELLLRTHGFQAYQAAAYQTMDAQRDVFPYWQYHTMGDGRVRPAHAALDKIVLPASSPFWDLHFPPWDWGCRCQLVPLSEDDAADVRAADAGKPVEERNFYDGIRQKVLEEQNRLVRTTGTMDVTPPSQKATSGSTPWQWHPGYLIMDTATLQSRYDAQTWAGFEGWAKATPLSSSDSRTVWEWMQIAPPVGPAPQPPAPTPAPTTPTPAPATPAAPPQPRTVAQMTADLDQAAAEPDARLRRQQMHAVVALDPAQRSTIQYRVKQDDAGLMAGFAFARSVTADALLQGPAVKIRRTRDRACADLQGTFIDGRQMGPSTVVHELGHIIEARSQATLAKSAAFLAKRTPGETPRWLGPGYKRREIALDDQWVARGGSRYSGKVYQTAYGRTYATEILSMGIERLYVDPAGFWAQDREYFTYVVDTLRGH